jgi:hypothetical protein
MIFIARERAGHAEGMNLGNADLNGKMSEDDLRGSRFEERQKLLDAIQEIVTSSYRGMASGIAGPVSIRLISLG